MRPAPFFGFGCRLKSARGLRSFVGFEEGEGLVVAAALEIMGELRLCASGELTCKARNFFGNGLKLVEVCGRIPLIEFPVGNNCEALLQGRCELAMSILGSDHGIFYGRFVCSQLREVPGPTDGGNGDRYLGVARSARSWRSASIQS